MFPERIETDRLVLERLCRENVDLFEYYGICSAPEMDEVTRYVPWEPHETVNASREFLADVERRWEDGERAGYLIRPADGEDGAGEFAGQGGLGLDWDRRTGTLGTWLRKHFWGRGYSGERAAALMALAFERLDLEVVAVTHHVGNENSERAIEKYVERFGGRREGVLRNFHADSDGVVDAVRYTVSREEWAANRPEDLGVDLRPE